MVYPTIDMRTPEQAESLNRIQIMQNECQFELIEIEQVSPIFKGGEGVVEPVVMRKRAEGEADDPEHPVYNYEHKGQWKGETLKFIPNPLPRKPLGTGRVAFLVNDNCDITSINAYSGEMVGWNMEFLAGLYGEKDEKGRPYFKIVDPRVDHEVKMRHAKILEKLAGMQPEIEEIRKKVAAQSEVEINRRMGVTKTTIDIQAMQMALGRSGAEQGQISNEEVFKILQQQQQTILQLQSEIAKNKPEENLQHNEKRKSYKNERRQKIRGKGTIQVPKGVKTEEPEIAEAPGATGGFGG